MRARTKGRSTKTVRRGRKKRSCGREGEGEEVEGKKEEGKTTRMLFTRRQELQDAKNKGETMVSDGNNKKKEKKKANLQRQPQQERPQLQRGQQQPPRRQRQGQRPPQQQRQGQEPPQQQERQRQEPPQRQQRGQQRPPQRRPLPPWEPPHLHRWQQEQPQLPHRWPFWFFFGVRKRRQEKRRGEEKTNSNDGLVLVLKETGDELGLLSIDGEVLLLEKGAQVNDGELGESLLGGHIDICGTSSFHFTELEKKERQDVGRKTTEQTARRITTVKEEEVVSFSCLVDGFSFSFSFVSLVCFPCLPLLLLLCWCVCLLFVRVLGVVGGLVPLSATGTPKPIVFLVEFWGMAQDFSR